MHRATWGRFALMLFVLLVAVPAVALAGPYTRLQVLLPGESAAPGTPSGKTGSPVAQTEGESFTVSVRACDDQWNTVTTVTNQIEVLSSDASATLPAPAQLSAGERIFTVTLNAAGTFTMYAHELTDPTIPDGASAPVSAFVLQGFEFSRINQKNQNAGQPLTITINAVDPGGNVVTGYSGPVKIKEVTSFGDGRTSPETIVLSAGTWTGPVTPFRADETSINRGNVNFYVWLENAPAKNGTSDPFTVHPGSFARVQLILPGETPLPGSVTGKTGTPASQAAGQNFTADVYATDNWWNPVSSADNVRITSGDPLASTPVTGAMSNGHRAFSLSLGTVGTQTLSVSDLSSGGIQGMTSPGINVIPSGAAGFAIDPIASAQTAGQPVTVTIRATDSNGNTIPNYNGDALLAANTGSGSISPELIAFVNGTWTGSMVFRGAGGAVSFTCSDFSSPPNFGTSNSFVVSPGPMNGLQVLLPGESPRGGTADGKEGIPTAQQAGSSFTLTLRAVDAFWNLVGGVNDSVALASSDAFAGIPAETTLANGQRTLPVTLFRNGAQRIWARDVSQPAMAADTSSSVQVGAGPYARLLVLAPGESVAPGSPNGRTGTATDQSIQYAFNVTVHSTDDWWNPVGGVSDMVRLTSDDPLATLPADTMLVDGTGLMPVRLARGGFSMITVSNVSQPSITGSSTQVRAISSGFHLEATVTPDTVRAGDPFTLDVRVTNDAGSVIQEINSAVTIEVRNASDQTPGRGTLLSTQFQLLQGRRLVSETYTFAEPIVLIAYDDAGNAPATSNVLVVKPGQPAAIQLTSGPGWVGGNKHATVSARLVDAFDNGVPAAPMTFQLLSGGGTLTPVDSMTAPDGVANADFRSPRTPGLSRIRAASGAQSAEMDLQTAFVDPNAAGGHVTNYPNPFHPPEQPTTVAYQLDDNARVTVRIFSQTGSLVRRETFDRGATGGIAGLNEWQWDGRNGRGALVASGGYLVLIEAQGMGETLHVMRRRIAVVR